jgi:hypothetical protein
MGTIFGGFKAEFSGQVILPLPRKERTLLAVVDRLEGVQEFRCETGKEEVQCSLEPCGWRTKSTVCFDTARLTIFSGPPT